MTKRYRSSSEISINITFTEGQTKRIRFSPLSSNVNVYYSNDEDEQKALETHPRYNELFIIDPDFVVPKKNEPEEEVKDTTPKIKTVKVNCIDDAKDYLADNFNVSRTHFKSKKAVVNYAAEKDVVFEGL